MKRALATLLIASSFATPAFAEEDELGGGRVIAVERRPYRLVHEFSFSAGIIPLDALYTGVSLGGSYTLHFSDLVAWEAVGFHYSANFDSGLDVTLTRRWSVSPTGEPRLNYFANTHLILTPFFGKLSFFNSSILHVATYFSFGGGVARFTDGFRPQGSVGPGLRIFLGQVVSSRLDVRGSIVPDLPSGVEFLLQVTLSVSFNFGERRATESGDDPSEVERRTGYESLDELYPLSDPDLGVKPEDEEG